MLNKRLIDANPFDRFIIAIPEYVYDPMSYIQGVEDVLDLVRKAKTENDEDGELSE